VREEPSWTNPSLEVQQSRMLSEAGGCWLVFGGRAENHEPRPGKRLSYKAQTGCQGEAVLFGPLAP
jgi:hypothetical protein